MHWIFIKIISDILSATKHIIMKKVVSSHAPNQSLHLLSIAIVSTPFAGIGLVYCASVTSLLSLLIILLSGISNVIANILYYQAIAIHKPTQLSLISRLSIVVTVLLSTIILHENLSLAQYISCGLSTLGGLSLMTGRIDKRIRLNYKTCIALCSVFWASLNIILTVYLLQSYPLWQTFTMTRIGVVIGTLAFLGLKSIKNNNQVLSSFYSKNGGALIGIQVLYIFILWLRTHAIAETGSATMLAILSGFSPLYVWGLSMITKHEPIQDRTWLKNVFAFLMFLGASFFMTR